MMKISSKSNPCFSRDLNSLKSDVENRVTGKRFLFEANERSDVYLLNSWISEMLAQAQKNNRGQPFFSYYMDLVSIYTGAVSEIARVVQTHCREQAVLLQGIWDDHLKVVVDYIRKVEEHNLNIDVNSLKEVSRVHEHYRGYLEKLQQRQSQFSELEERYRNEVAELQRENTYLRRKELRREKELQLLMKSYEQVLGSNQTLSTELGHLIHQQQGFERVMSDPSQDVHRRVSFLAQAQYLLAQFSEKRKEGVVAKKEEKEEEEDEEISQSVIFKDEGCDTFDLITRRSIGNDTREYATYIFNLGIRFISYKSREVQAVKYQPTLSTFVQVGAQMRSVWVQTEFQKENMQQEKKVEKVKVDVLEENHSNNKEKIDLSELKVSPINYYTLVQVSSQYSMKEIVRAYQNLSFPIQIDERKACDVPFIVEAQMGLFQESVKSLFLFLVHQETSTKEDVLELYEYITINSEQIKQFYSVVWELVKRYSSRYTDQLLEAYERRMDYDAVQVKLKFNMSLYKTLHSKYKEVRSKLAEMDPTEKNKVLKVKKFTQKLKDKIKNINSSRFAKQKLLQPANEIFLNVRPEQVSQQFASNFNNSSDVQLQSEQTEKIPPQNFGLIPEPAPVGDEWKLDEEKEYKQSITLLPSVQNLDSIQSVPKLMIRKNGIDESYLQSEQSCKEESSESSYSQCSLRNLKLELKILRPKLVFEKRFRIKKITSRHADIATSLMKMVLKKNSGAQSTQGLLQERTVLKYLSQFVYIYLKRVSVQGVNAVGVPFYVHCFEQFFQQGGMQPLAGQKFERFVRSVIHYTSNDRILLFSRFLTGELDSQDFNFYITMIQHFDDAKGTGLGLFRSLSDDYLWVPLPKLAAINKLFHNGSADSVYPYIDSLKQTSISNATRYIVDFDSMCAILLKVYQDERRMLNSVLVDVFNAVDIDRTGMMRLEEFRLLCAISNIELFLAANLIPSFFISVDCVLLNLKGKRFPREWRETDELESFHYHLQRIRVL